MLVWVAGGLSGNVQEAALAGVGEVAFRCRGTHLGRSGARELQAVGASAKALGLDGLECCRKMRGIGRKEGEAGEGAGTLRAG